VYINDGYVYVYTL